jgi:hypothetical protein
MWSSLSGFVSNPHFRFSEISQHWGATITLARIWKAQPLFRSLIGWGEVWNPAHETARRSDVSETYLLNLENDGF